MSDSTTAATSVASPDDFDTPVARWRAELDVAKHEFHDWWMECDRIERVYRSERRRGGGRPQAFAILWSNVETLKPAIYCRPPVPVVARTFGDADPVGRAASMLLRRNIQQMIEEYRADRKLKQVRDDYLLYARGVMWARYEATIGTPPQVTEDSEELGERLESEAVEWDFIRRDDFLHASAPNWDAVTWVARRVRMTRDDGVKRFGAKFRQVPLSYKPDQSKRATETASYDVISRAVVYEIWDKREREVTWIADGYDKVLDTKPDPLRLRDFFPTPRPLYGTLTDSSLVPIPDYQEYQPQAEQLDDLTRRIRALTKAIRASGVYDSQYPEIKRMFAENAENEIIPVKNFAALAQSGGLMKAIDLLPVLEMAQTLETLIAARAQVKSDLYEITGISDVIRGAETSGPEKTATEVRTKGRYATLRLFDRQLAMAEYVRDVLRITAEIIAEHFSSETLWQASNWEATDLARDSGDPVGLFQQAVALLRNDRLRGFRIDVEDRSTIALDEAEEKAARIEFLTAVGDYIEKAITIPPEMAPVLAPALGKMLMFGVRAFPVGLELEMTLEDTIARMDRFLQQKAAQPPQPSPDMLKAQADMARAQADIQIKQQESQAKLQGDMLRAQAEQRKADTALAIAQANLEIKRIEAAMAGVRLQADTAQAAAQNAQDETDHLLAIQDADLAAREFQHQVDIDWAKLGIEERKVDVQAEAARRKETAE